MHTNKNKVIAILSSIAILGNIAGTPLTAYATNNNITAEPGETYTISKGYYSNPFKITIPALKDLTPGTATASDILAGKKAWINGREVAGTMQENTAVIGNKWQSGNNAGLGITADNTNIDITNQTELLLGVGESVTLPAGYYPNDITIKNNVANRGSSLSAMALAYLSDNSNAIPNAYYESLDDAISTAYQMGLTNGATNTNLDNVDITYTVKHTHKSSCYPSPAFVYVGSEYNKYIERYDYIWRCSICNRQFGDENSDGWTARQTFNAHLVNGHCPNSSFTCGKAEGTRTTTDVTTLTPGDEVISATIAY